MWEVLDSPQYQILIGYSEPIVGAVHTSLF